MLVKQIGEHKVSLPVELPSDSIEIPSSLGGTWKIPLNELILNYGLEYDQAYWNRDLLPEFFYKYIPDETLLFCDETEWRDGMLYSLSDKDTKRLIYLLDRELYRRKYGVWFLNGITPEYLTGHHYFFLQWMKLYGLNDRLLPEWRQSGYQYAEYMEYQRDVFYLIEHVWMNKDILGLYIAKPKKTGITQLFAAYYLNKATTTRDAMMGVMSKGMTGAADVNMLFTIKGYDGLPPIFQPNIKERADTAGKLFFGEAALRNVKTAAGKERRKALLDARPLDTKIYAAKTKEAGFDSPIMQDIEFDEFCKYWSENKKEPEIIFNRNIESVTVMGIYNGRCWIMNYPPEEDDLGFIQGRKVYFDSKLSTIPKGGKRTKTGLIAHYISALYSYRSCINKYGKCNEKLAHELNQAERDKVKGDKKAFQAKIRQYSENEQECWAAAGAGSTFDLIRVGELKQPLQAEMQAERQFEDGRLEWENQLWEAGGHVLRPRKMFGKIKWVPLTIQEIERGDVGRLRIYQHIPHQHVMEALRMGRDNDRNLLAPPTYRYYGGADPTDYAAEGEVIEGSKNASYTLNFPDPALDNFYKRIASNIIISEYFYRPQIADEFYEDLVKEILYFGKCVIVEANKKWVATKLIEDGLGRYMLVIDRSDGQIKPWNNKMYTYNKEGNKIPNWGLISSTSGGIDKNFAVRVISRYIAAPKNLEVDKDYGRTIKSERLLSQLESYSKEYDKLHDLVRAFGWALICYEYLTQPSALPQINSHLYSRQMKQRVARMLSGG